MMTPPMQYRALLIDLDGVIRRWTIPNDVIETECNLPVGAIFKIAFSPEHLAPAITGLVTDDVWRARITAQLARDHHGSAAEEAVARWSAPNGDIDADTLALLDRCNAHLRVVLVTNATSRLTQDLRALGIADRFHAIVNSSDIGVAKPAQEFYRIALEHAGVAADHALFVDDSLPNVQAAMAYGIRAHRFIGHLECAAFLESSGVLRSATVS